MSDTTFQDYVTPIPSSWLNDVNDHTYNSTPVAPATTVHPANVIANTPAGTIAATTVQNAINELDTDIQGHIADVSAAHTASAIANIPAGSIAATDVQAAINELDTEKLASATAATTYAPIAGSISQAFAVSGLEVGHATDTTLTRSAAGTLAVEGVNILTTATGGKRVAQIVDTRTGAVATGTTVLPFDDSIPQNTEGDQYMSLSITPTNSSSVLLIEVAGFASHSASTTIIAALFQDTTANALASAAHYQPTATALVNLGFSYYMTAGTTSATTFKVRIGAPAAGTTTFNGVVGARYLGGVFASSITITEYLP